MYMSRALVAILVSISSLWANAYGATVCDSDNLRQVSGLKGHFSSTTELFSITGQTTNLHIMGEAHFYTDTTLLRRLITEIKPHLLGQKKCVFLEIPKGGLKQFATMFEEYARRPNLSPHDHEKIQSWSKYYPAIVQAAEQNGMQVLEIDHPDHLSGDKTEDERNVAMAQNAARLLTNSTCDSAVYFVGKAHISPLGNHPSVIVRLRALGLKPTTYNLSDFSERSDVRLSSWFGLTCNPRDVLPDAFANSNLIPETKLYPFLPSERKPLWNDFDYSISR